MVNGEETNTLQEKIYTFSIFAIVIVASIIGFVYIPENLNLPQNEVIKIWIIYSVLGIFLPLLTMGDILLKIKWFYSFLWNPEKSIIGELYKRNPKNPTLKILNSVNSSIILSTLFWFTFWAIPMFLATLFAPQSSIGIFIGRYVFPVRPQSIFSAFTQQTFFTVFPAPTETGALVALISFTNSVLEAIITIFASRLVSLWISFFLVGFLLSGVYWRFIHNTVSAGREIDATGHTFFGIESGLFTIITGQWTAALALHVMNLFFWSIRDTLGSYEFLRTGLIWAVIIVFIGINIFILVYNLKKKTSVKRNRKNI